jgi:hypothetical protein
MTGKVPGPSGVSGAAGRSMLHWPKDEEVVGACMD